MKVRLRYFASIREALGASEEIEVDEASSVAALRDRLIARDERHAAALGRGKALRVALNQTLCDESARLAAGDEVAFFPPVTGG